MPNPARLADPFLARPLLIAPVLGAAAACGFEPLRLWPLALLAIAILIELLARARTGGRAALIGWLFGTGHFTIGNNWIATAFTYQANMPAWLGWMAVVVLSLYLAVYPMLATWGAWLLRRGRDGRARAHGGLVLALAGCWIVTEWLRSWVFTGFAWNPLAMVAMGPFDRPGLASQADWLGTYALSGVVVLLAGCWAIAVRRTDRAVLAVTLAVLPIAAMLLPDAGGAPPGRRPGPAFTLIQPDIRQEHLDDPRLWESQFVKAARLSSPDRAGQRRLVLWPESGIPDYLRDGYPRRYYLETTFAGDPGVARRRIGRVIGPGGLLLTGAVDLEIRDGRAVAARNVVTAIDSSGAIRGSYAKAHLVPYGEYLALRWLLEPLGATRLVPGALDFQPGPGPGTVDLGAWGKAGIQICYEIVFSGQVVEPGNRPDYIFNPSNDGWFGSWGPPQHLAQARLRAIEEGLPVLRATTTGISAVIDADGNVRQFLSRHRPGRLDGTVPPAHPPTPFARLGNMLPLAWAVVLLVLSVIALRRRGS